MRKIHVAILATSLLMSGLVISCKESSIKESRTEYREGEENEENEEYDGAMERALLEIEKTKDPALGYVPSERLFEAITTTNALKSSPGANSLGLIWQERGPIYDSIGSSNGNGRGGGGGTTFPNTYTSGRIRAILVDTSDNTGNTVFAGGVGGGLWKTTNFLTTPATWLNVNDFFDNLAISSICQDPTNLNTIYFSTGEPTANADAIMGKGIWKSTDHGVNWTLLPATSSYNKIFKVLCDASGNLYVALRNGGLRRSNNGGTSFTDISPTGYSGESCTDFEFTSSGALHASFGYTYNVDGNATIRYTTSPSTVSATDWITPSGLPGGNNNRIEMAATAAVVYLLTVNTSNNIAFVYKSVDDGATYTRQNSSAYPDFTSTQGWYDISFDVNPGNTSDIIMGQLDAYRSSNSGSSITKITNWVNTAPYVHADHHFVKMIRSGVQTRIIMGSDGGIFYSANGSTFVDKNRNLGLKQFYSCAIHPTLPNYFLAGAQDNGTHRLNQPGLTYSFEVSGGDGGFCDIDQDEPQFQFNSYVYNQYRRSTNGGNSWSNFYFSSSAGLFINPFDYDDINNKLYGSYGTQLFRWNNPTTATNFANADTTRLIIPGATGNISSLYASPNTNNRVFVGTNSGKLFRIDNASTVTNLTIGANTTNITGPSFTGFLNCIIAGDDDQKLLAIFTNYGVNNVWYSTDGGSNWVGIDGNLPDMPVRWGVFAPGYSDKVVLATEAGVYVTNAVNGASTVWMPSPEFPTVKTNMLKVRKADKLIIAATHGRGIWSSYIPSILPIKNLVLQATASDANSHLTWTQTGATAGTKFTIQYSINGVSFTNIATVDHLTAKFVHQLSAPVGYYRIMAEEPNGGSIYSNTVVVRSAKITAGVNLKISPNPVINNGNFTVSSSSAQVINWALADPQGKILQSSKTSLPAGGSINLPVQTYGLAKSIYYIRITTADGIIKTTPFVKQ